MLSGDNSIINQAGNAKTQTDVAGEKEIIQIAAVGAMGKSKYGDIDETYFTNELEKNNATVTKSGSKYKVSFTNGRQYTVDQEGNVKEKNPNELEVEDLNGSFLGADVEYSGYDASYLGGWRIFYATEEETFIISTETINSNIEFGSSNSIPLVSKNKDTTYTGSFDIANSKYGRTWNKIWVVDQIHQSTEKINGTNPSSLQGDVQHKAVAYLCDSNNWKNYVVEGLANYAVGGPTIELFIKAWQNRPNGSNIDITGTTDYGYKTIVSSGINKTILSEKDSANIGLYNNGSSYYLASPNYYSAFKDLILVLESENNGIRIGRY